MLATTNSKFWMLPTFFICGVFALMAGKGSLAGMGALIGLIALLLMLFSGIRVIAILLLIGVPTIFVFPNTAIQALPFVNTERFLFGCIMGLLFLNFLFSHKSIEPLISPEKFAMGFLLVAILSYFFSVLSGAYVPKPNQDAFFVIQYVMGFSGFVVARRLNWDLQLILRLIDILLIVGLFMTAQAILQYFLGMDVFVPDYLEVPHADEGRVTGTFANSSEYGAVAATILFLGVFRYSQTKDHLARTAIIGILGMVCVAIFLSKTRAPWLAVAVSMMLIAYLDAKVRPMIVFCGVLGTVAAIVLLPFLVDFNSIQERLSSLAPIYNRLSLWVSGISMGIQNPLLGVGFGTEGFQTAHPHYTIDIGGISAYWAAGVGVPHNEFVHIFALTGFTGLALYLGVLWTSFKQLKLISANQMISPESRVFAMYAGVILVNWMLNGLFVDTGLFWYLMFLMFFIVGAAISFSKQKAANQ
ncbi:O-antigen ligase family protein [Aliiglaciecola lipolytica]|uniref:O-antigen ligase-related domain-containing protein n=1 Tax=Aliiglaciecola lipolytica E3 TaxID=1127673 RepID=K6Y651_9ALTE|nr:O-antigen ligase family protein [Aliiglaciecola lipolytica]GAC13707.1 hypothetical protein GLIP_1065 [Aliiglaciecola lipolytica E3]